MCVYVCTIAHMRSHDDEFYSVTCIHDMCAVPCMCGSLPSPNCLPFHMHAWKVLVYSSRAASASSYEDELQNKPWREFLCKVAVTCMHMQCKFSCYSLLLSQMQFLHATSILSCWFSILPHSDAQIWLRCSCANAGGQDGAMEENIPPMLIMLQAFRFDAVVVKSYSLYPLEIIFFLL
jgi:hypothetical protein